MRSRQWTILAAALGIWLAPMEAATEAEGPLREGVRLPILGPDREPIDLLRTPPEEVERRLWGEPEVAPDAERPMISPWLQPPLPPDIEPLPEEEVPAAAEKIEVAHIQIAASRPGEGVVLAEAALANNAERAHRLVDVYTGAAEDAILHVVERHGGVRQVRPLSELHLPPGEETQLRGGGPQLLLVDLRRPLRHGEVITLALRFGDGSRKRIEVPVGGRSPRQG